MTAKPVRGRSSSTPHRSADADLPSLLLLPFPAARSLCLSSFTAYDSLHFERQLQQQQQQHTSNKSLS